MPRSNRPLAAVAAAAALLFAPGVVSAQTTTTTTPTSTTGLTIAPSFAISPDRIVDGVDEGQSTRPQNLNPLGLNYDDCLKDMKLRFTLLLSGFAGTTAASLQVWASTGDCTQPNTRAVGIAGATCWKIQDNPAPLTVNAPQTFTFADINVRDIVGPQNAIPQSPSVSATQAHGEGLGTAACNTQGTFTGVPMVLWFMAVDTTNNIVGTPYAYGQNSPFVTDMVGPPAPVISPIADGDTLMVINWMPNVDTDTAGYDVFMDPPPGQEDASAAGPPDATVLYCPPGSSSSSGGTSSSSSSGSSSSGGMSDTGDMEDTGEAGDATGIDATADATVASTSSSSSGAANPEAGCFYINAAGPPAQGGACADTVLTQGIVLGSGGTTPTVTDDAGDVLEAGTTVTGAWGHSTIPANYLVGAGPTGVTVSDKNTGTFTVTGLKNGTTYTAVVAAVDGSGNIGPSSSQECDFPAPVNDFWNLYRQGGGKAGGSLCSVDGAGEPASAFGAAALLLATGIVAARRGRRA